MVEKDYKMNKTLDELVNEDKKLAKFSRGKHREDRLDKDDREDRRYPVNRTRDRSFSDNRKRGKRT